MSYSIHYTDIEAYAWHYKAAAEQWFRVLEKVETPLKTLAESEGFTGKTAIAFHSYVESAQLVIIQGIRTLLQDFMFKMETYKNGYYTEIDNHSMAVLDEEAFTLLLQHFEASQGNFVSSNKDIAGAHDEVADLLTVPLVYSDNIDDDYAQEAEIIRDLNTQVLEYEQTHKDNDLADNIDLLGTLSAAIKICTRYMNATLKTKGISGTGLAEHLHVANADALSKLRNKIKAVLDSPFFEMIAKVQEEFDILWRNHMADGGTTTNWFSYVYSINTIGDISQFINDMENYHRRKGQQDYVFLLSDEQQALIDARRQYALACEHAFLGDPNMIIKNIFPSYINHYDNYFAVYAKNMHGGSDYSSIAARDNDEKEIYALCYGEVIGVKKVLSEYEEEGNGPGYAVYIAAYGTGKIVGTLHMKYPPKLQVGDWVVPDTQVGVMGATGNSPSGPHTHRDERIIPPDWQVGQTHDLDDILNIPRSSPIASLPRNLIPNIYIQTDSNGEKKTYENGDFVLMPAVTQIRIRTISQNGSNIDIIWFEGRAGEADSNGPEYTADNENIRYKTYTTGVLTKKNRSTEAMDAWMEYLEEDVNLYGPQRAE